MTQPIVSELWHQACGVLAQKLSPALYQTWILSNPLIEFQTDSQGRGLAKISSPTAFHAQTIDKNFRIIISETLSELVGVPVELEVIVSPPNSQVVSIVNSPSILDEQIKQTPTSLVASISQTQTENTQEIRPANTKSRRHSSPVASLQEKLQQLAANRVNASWVVVDHNPSPRVENLFADSTLASLTLDRAKSQAQKAGLRTDYTFETFAVSSTNELAHAAALAVSDQPGSAYNPLFIYGGVGVGKTHLMHAVGNNILKHAPDTRLLYCTGEDFTNEIVDAIQTKKAMQFKDKYRTVDVLLIDDVQFIAGKNTVQEEFFHTFNSITKHAGQIILTSDRSPQEISLLEDRLRSRFEAGLMVDIQQPSFELRTAILLIKSSHVNIPLTMEMAQFVAERVDSARKIEGFIKSLRSEIEFKHAIITMELLEKLLQVEEAKPIQRLRVKPSEVIRVVADHYQFKHTAVRGKQRTAPLVKARHLAIYLMKEDLGLSLVEIGRWFGNRDHTTALHAIRKINQQLQLNPDLMEEYQGFKKTLQKISR